jgi:hypothetical protein
MVQIPSQKLRHGFRKRQGGFFQRFTHALAPTVDGGTNANLWVVLGCRIILSHLVFPFLE